MVENSPAAQAGLIGGSDYIIGADTILQDVFSFFLSYSFLLYFNNASKVSDNFKWQFSKVSQSNSQENGKYRILMNFSANFAH